MLNIRPAVSFKHCKCNSRLLRYVYRIYIMNYNLALMADRIRLLMIQPTKKHRNGIMWIIGNRYPDELEATKREFMKIWEKK